MKILNKKSLSNVNIKKEENTIYCLNCGEQLNIDDVKIYNDKIGKHAICPKCGSSFDI